MDGIGLGLKQALESGDCVLFVGAGIGFHLADEHGGPAPDGTTLARELAEHFGIEVGDNPDLAKISQLIEIRKKGRTELEAFIKRRLSALEPDEAFRWLTTLRWRAIFTTNYDNAIQRAYSKNPNPPQTPVTMAATSDLVPFERRFQVPIYHLHGTLFDVEKPRIIITEDDYAAFRDRRQMLFNVLKQEFATSTFLYIGYSNRDPNWKMLLEELRAEFFPAQTPQSYRVAPVTDPLDEEILRSKGIETTNASYDDFQKAASVALAGSRISPDVLKRLESSIPSDLLGFFDKHPASVARLLAGWEYVNQAAFNAAPNTRDFLLGNRANWALVAKRLHFERDLEPLIYDDVLDYATSAAKKPMTALILGPAGYGRTTLLMSLAASLVSEKAGPVFFQKAGTPLLEGDIEFASSIFDDACPFFFIDNAADNIVAVHNAINRLRMLSKQAVVLIGERLNEWRSTHGRVTGTEYLQEPLSDVEINKLLDCLSSNNSLNKLGELSRELQFAAIKRNHQQELLVAMREATEGKAFDAILEDEYRGIPDELARRMYLIVCCFYQHGAYVRDSLLAELINVPLSELHEKTAVQTEGVVVFDEIDPAYGRYAARARHRKIAAVVWERTADAGEREDIVVSALTRMNLNYSTDAKAFEDFVRSDRLVDSIRTLDSRIRFFENACQKDPQSPYVRQHYARMLLRSNQLNLALAQIDSALSINPELRVLHHTRGVVLAELALSTESTEIARRRLVQSEEEFRKCLHLYPKDDYAYQTLAKLFVDWAHRMADSNEAAEYLAKAEAVIDEGLRVVKVRDGLWIVSAAIQELVGKQPEYFKALQRAVTSATTSVIPRYLLARAYRKSGRPEDTISVLKPVIETHPDEFRSFVEYAQAMYDSGESYAKCIAVLRMSTLYGYSDPRFVATLGGMLFMNEEFSAAKDVFMESYRREFPAEEAKKIQFRPTDGNDPKRRMRLTGKVSGVKPGYSFIEVPGYAAFMCPGSHSANIIMRFGMTVSFEPAFTARGAVADRLQLAP